MATNGRCELWINLNVYLMGPESKDFVLRWGNLNEIDSYTYRYQDKFALFEKEKEELLKKVRASYMQDFGLAPTDIELGKKGIYVIKDGEEKQALFQNIVLDDLSIPLEAVVLDRMVKGNLITFYKCDKRRMVDDSYQSFFDNFGYNMIDRLELECPTKQDISVFYNSILNKNRFYQAIRFLLIKPNSSSIEEAYEKFLSYVNLYEVTPNAGERHNHEETYYYRYPYKND